MYQPIYPRNAPLPSAAALPTMYDLPSEDPEDPGLPDLFHLSQPRLLDETFRSPSFPADRVLTATDLNLYYDPHQTRWYKRPDWFLVLGVASGSQQRDLRLSYVTWQEAVNPFLVVELLSPGTEAEDLGQTLREVNQPPTKWQVYEQILRIPYYGVFDRYTLQFRLFRLVATRYEEVVLDHQRYWFSELQLGLGLWSGHYGGVEGEWLRWYEATGNWLATAAEQTTLAQEQATLAQEQTTLAQEQATLAQEQATLAQEQATLAQEQATLAQEQAEEERQRAEQAQQQAEEERQRAERLAARLRSLGIDPDAEG